MPADDNAGITGNVGAAPVAANGTGARPVANTDLSLDQRVATLEGIVSAQANAPAPIQSIGLSDAERTRMSRLFRHVFGPDVGALFDTDRDDAKPAA